MPPKLMVATKNRHKIDEIQRLLPGIDLVVLTGDVDLPEETGTTFEANALLKAQAIAKATGEWALSDDSGLVVDALDGAPGVYSARFATEGTDQANRMKVLAELKGRASTATMVSVIALVSPLGHQVTTRGEVVGRVVEPKGPHGFGYDPIFYVDAIGKTFGEATPEEKTALSHRALAIKQVTTTPLWRMMIDG
jgi:XTP/dITP diphosphohydrolase